MKIGISERGFASVIAPVIMVILVVAAVFVVYQRNDDDVATSEATIIQTQQKERPEPSAEPEAPASEAIVIDEWNVRVSLRDYDQVTYSFSSEAGDLGHQGTEYDSSVTPEFVEGAVGNSDCGIGLAMYRSSSEPDFRTAEKVGDLYYFATGSPGACDNDPESADNQLKQRVLEDFTAANVESI